MVVKLENLLNLYINKKGNRMSTRDRGTIIRHIPYNGYDAVFEVEFIDIHDEPLRRTYFVSNEGVSRHVDFENMEKCCRGELLFDRDAFFFRGDRAIYEAKTLLKCAMISNHCTNFLEKKIEEWQPEEKEYAS
jgi:hypothetical protein